MKPLDYAIILFAALYYTRVCNAMQYDCINHKWVKSQMGGLPLWSESESDIYLNYLSIT